jgi:hypothetical protein
MDQHSGAPIRDPRGRPIGRDYRAFAAQLRENHGHSDWRIMAANAIDELLDEVDRLASRDQPAVLCAHDHPHEFVASWDRLMADVIRLRRLEHDIAELVDAARNANPADPWATVPVSVLAALITTT